MRTKIKKETMVEKWEVKYENDYTISIWKYNSKISRTNPYEITIEYKGEPEVKRKRSTRKKKV